MAVDKLNSQTVTLFLGQYQRQINTLIVAFLALYLLAFLADLVWRIIPEPQHSAQNSQQTAVSGSISSKPSVQLNINALKRLNLFGQVNEAAPVVQQEAVTDAPETRLNLVLTGVVSSTNVDFGAAIIEHKGSQNTYGIGERIEGTNASLQQVQADRVIIKNGARNETLMLDGIDFEEANQRRIANGPRANPRQSNTRTASSNRRAEEQSPAQSSGLSPQAIEATQQLRASPDSFIDFISISPHRENNEMIGFRVSPGKNPSLFEAAGLENDDVITQINGLDVTDAQQSMEAMGALRSAQFIELTVSRDGSLLTLYLELPEPEDA